MRDRVVGAVAVLLAAVALATGCVPGAPDVVLERSDRFDPPLELPAPDRAGETTLEQVLAERRSQRAFADTELSLATIGQLFWAGQGISDDAGHRTAPSAGSLYPLELYALTPSLLLRYLPDGHQVEQRSEGTALGLAATPVGGFDPDDASELLALPPGHEVLYLVPVGEPPR